MGKKVLTTSQIRRIEELTMRSQQLQSWALMEKAAIALRDWIKKRYVVDDTVFLVFAGPGNNGGDGLALARLLYDEDADLACVLWSEKGAYSPDNSKNQKLARRLGIPFLKAQELEQWVLQQKKPIVGIDALFGIGFKGILRPFYQPAINLINDRRRIAEVLSVDMPSGLPTSKEIPENQEGVVRASHTLSFEFPKPSFFYKNHQDYLREWHLLDIGFDQEAIAEELPVAETIHPMDFKNCLKRRNRFDYKNSLGHIALCGGSYGKYGALIMAARACLRSGAGLLSVLAPKSAFSIIQTAVPEAMYAENKGKKHLSSVPDLSDYQAIAIGPGMGQNAEGIPVVRAALASGKPLVIDADALNLMAHNRELLKLLHDQCLLTPHVGEFKRLVGDWHNEAECREKLHQFSNEYQCTILLKGPYTLIATRDTPFHYINTSGNPGMAVGGMGDALTGVLAALLGRGYKVNEAARLGVFVHGRAGDLAVEYYSQEALTPSDLIDYIPKVWKELYNN